MTIQVQDLTISFQDKAVLKQVSLHAEVNKLLAICGPNGAGKSTLLKAISGDISVPQGHVTINGEDIAQLSPALLATKRAMMPQHVELSFSFSVFEVIEAGVYLTDDNIKRQSVIDHVARLLELSDLLDKPYFQLSGGQKQRVQLARVIAQLLQSTANQPRYLLLDECSSAMDIAMVHQVFTLLKQLSMDQPLNIGVIAVVHDLNIASLYADEIALISDNRCQYSGVPDTILTTPIINEVFSTQVQVLPHPENNQPMILPTAPVFSH